MVFGPFWSENGYTHYPFWSGIGNGFRRNYGSVWTYFLSFQFQINKKNRNMRNRNAFDEMFACALIQVITAWHNFYLKAKSKWHFLVWNRVRIWKTSCTPPPRIPTSTPPGILHIMRTPPPPKKKKKLLINLLSAPSPLVAAKASLLHCAWASSWGVLRTSSLQGCSDHMNRFFHPQQTLTLSHPRPDKEGYQISWTTT